MKKRSILLISNNELIKWAIYNAFKKGSFEIDHSIDCIDAKSMINIKKYEYIIIDAEKELDECKIEDLRELQPDSFIIILTNCHFNLKDKKIKYLIKPFKIEEIRYIINSTM